MVTTSKPMGSTQASTYYEKDNYYMKDSQFTQWNGKLAEEFGINKTNASNNIHNKDFYAILHGLNPKYLTDQDMKDFQKLDKEKEHLEKKIKKWAKDNKILVFDKENNPFKAEVEKFNEARASLIKSIDKRNGLEKLSAGDKVTVGDRDNIGTVVKTQGNKVVVHFINNDTGKEATRTFDKELIHFAGSNSVRLNRDTKNKFGLLTKERAGFDVTTSAPKSVSILSLVEKNQDIIDAHRKANAEVLKYIENELAQVRVKDPITGKRVKIDSENILSASFEHYTSRAVAKNIAPDPQLHTHNFIANIVKTENGYRSMEAPEIYKKQMALGQIYQNALAKEIEKLGYELEWRKEKKGNYTFEVKGMEEAIEKFSKRTVAIKEHIATLEAERGYKLSKEELEIAKNEIRVPKVQQKMENLQNDWNQQIKDSNLKIAAPVLSEEKKIKMFNTELIKKEELEKIISDAYKIVEDKESVLNKTNILHEALKDSRGRYTADDVLEALDNHKEINKIDKHNYASYELEAIEKDLISKYELSQGNSQQIAKNETVENFLEKFQTVTVEEMEKGAQGMKADQKAFIREVLTNNEQITLIQGDAGTGKTYAIKELNAFVKENVSDEYEVIGLAPTGKAVGELREKAGISSKTVESFLMQDNLKTTYKIVENEVVKERKISDFTEAEVKKLNFSKKELDWLQKKESERGLELKSSFHYAKDSIKSALIKGTYHIPIVRWANALSTDKTFRNEYIGRQGAVYTQTDIKKTLWDKFVTGKQEKTTFTTKVDRETGKITKTLTKVDKDGNVTTVNLSNKDNSKFSIGYKSREDYEFTKVTKSESYIAKVKEKIAQEKKPRIIIVDESSMLSTKDMAKIVEKLRPEDKIVFAGDIKQFKSVQQGSFFDHLQKIGKVTEMKEKTRQKTAFTKEVVAGVEEGEISNVIQKIADFGNLTEIKNSAHLKEKFVNNIIDDIKKGKDTLALVSTNVQREEMNRKIRDSLIKNNIVGGNSKEIEILEPIKNNDFDKKQFQNYEPGNILKSSEMQGDIKVGTELKILSINIEKQIVEVQFPNGKIKDLNVDNLLKMEQYKIKNIELKEGDTIIFNKNQGDLKNGTTAKISKIDGDNITIFANNKEQNFNYKKDKHLDYGYVLTLHKSQGMDGKEVHVFVDNMTNKNAFYVAVTRAVENVKAYLTDQKDIDKKIGNEQIKENIVTKKEEIREEIEALKNPIRKDGKILDENGNEIIDERSLEEIKADFVEKRDREVKEISERPKNELEEKISSYENKVRNSEKIEIDEKKLKELIKLAQLERDGDFGKEDTLKAEASRNAFFNLQIIKFSSFSRGRAEGYAEYAIEKKLMNINEAHQFLINAEKHAEELSRTGLVVKNSTGNYILRDNESEKILFNNYKESNGNLAKINLESIQKFEKENKLEESKKEKNSFNEIKKGVDSLKKNSFENTNISLDLYKDPKDNIYKGFSSFKIEGEYTLNSNKLKDVKVSIEYEAGIVKIAKGLENHNDLKINSLLKKDNPDLKINSDKATLLKSEINKLKNPMKNEEDKKIDNTYKKSDVIAEKLSSISKDEDKKIVLDKVSLTQKESKSIENIVSNEIKIEKKVSNSSKEFAQEKEMTRPQMSQKL